MAKMLTAKAVERYKKKSKRREIRDSGCAGLYLIIQPSGVKSWAMRFRRPNGKPAKLTLGTVDLSGKEIEGEPVIGTPLSLASARVLAGMVHRERARERDVVADRKAEKHKQKVRIAEDAENNFAAMARLYLTDHAKPKLRQWRELARVLGFTYTDEGEFELVSKGISANWSNRPIASITQHDISPVVDDAKRQGIPGTRLKIKGKSESRGRAVHATLASLFKYLRDENKVATNPVRELNWPEPPEKRERVLNPDEVRWFWKACDAADAPRIESEPKPYAPVLRLLLLSGQRLNEVAGMRRSEMQGDEWHLPKERTKNKRTHIVPLPQQARDLIPAGDGNLVFTTTGTTPVSGWGKVKQRLDEKMLELAREEKGQKFEIPHWTLHDLRRTAVTGMRSIGISTDVVEATVNHVSGFRAGVAGTYDRYALLPERKVALERWAAHVLGLVSGRAANVVPIRQRKKRRAS